MHRVELKLPVEPTFLLHREVTVRWDGGAWYKGVVKNYNELSFEHKVRMWGHMQRLCLQEAVPWTRQCSYTVSIPAE